MDDLSFIYFITVTSTTVSHIIRPSNAVPEKNDHSMACQHNNSKKFVHASTQEIHRCQA